MTIVQRFLPVAILTAMLCSPQISRAGEANAWDGTWNGVLGKTNPWPISVSIANGKVVSFTEKGTPFDVRYTKVTPDTVSFGDQTHYTIKLTKTGETTASAKVHGRHGVGTAILTKS